jgi:acyl-CoA synthetase (AMP-forming)/AMP-acid ligase II
MSARPEEGLEANRRFFQRSPDAFYYIEERMPEQATMMLERDDPYDPSSAQAYIVKALIPALQGRYREAEGHIPALLEKARAYPFLYHVVARIYALQGKSEEAMKWLTLWANGFVDLHDREVPTGEVGEIVARGPNIMKGYWNRPDITAETCAPG